MRLHGTGAENNIFGSTTLQVRNKNSLLSTVVVRTFLSSFHPPAYEFKVVQMVRIDVAGGVDLEAVVVLVGILEEAIHGVQHLVRHSEEPLACHAPVVQPLLTLQTNG